MNTNKQYFWRECLEISGIPASLPDIGLKSNVLEILKEIYVPINPCLVEDCHRLPFKGLPKKVILKLNRRKGIRRILFNKSKLKKVKPELVNLPGATNVFIDEGLRLYFKKTVYQTWLLVTFPRFMPAKYFPERSLINGGGEGGEGRLLIFSFM